MKTTNEYIELLKKYKTTRASVYGITRLGIFGSVARGEQTEKSDIDVCIESCPIGLFTLCRLKGELEELLGCTVDILRMRNQLDGTSLKKSIMEDIIYV